MDAIRWQRVRALFERAAALASDAQAAFLTQACADDTKLRAEVEALLEADRHAGSATALEAVAPAVLESFSEEEARLQRMQWVGMRLGPWKLGAEIGRGGMGAVHLAERDDGAYAQRAAVKLVRPGWDALELLRRFRAERQILASLVHPHIARLLDGGVSDDGKPYLVLEYIDGQPINRYCDDRHLDLHQRLTLFLDVCAAVSHAHRALVVHRDLKPSNILVDTEGVVKLLDFGIAKLLDGEGMPSASALRAFTPEYAAPEQVRGEPTTTGVDIYALGLLLYELLTGRRPYSNTGSTPAAYEQAVLTQEPERPSRAVAQADAQAHTLALARELDPARLAARLRGDLDAIVLRALRKDPGQRYASVEALASDVRNYLERRPVAARRGNWRYRSGRFLRRHALASGLAALALLSLTGGLAAALWQAGIARNERDAAQRSEQQARAVSSFLTDVFSAADPASRNGADPPASELLAEGVRQIDAQPDLDSSTQAALLYALGAAQLARGDVSAGLPLMQRSERAAFQGDDPGTQMRALMGVGDALNNAGKLDEADQWLQRARDFGVAHPTLPRALIEEADYVYATNLISLNRKDEALAVFVALVRRHQAQGSLLDDLPLQAATMLIYLYGATRQPEAALALSQNLYDATRALKDVRLDQQKTVYGVHAYALMTQSRMADAEQMFRDTLAIDERIYGAGHLKTVVSINNLAVCLSRQSRYADAMPLMDRAVEIRRAQLPADHPDLASALAKAGANAERLDQLPGALARLQEGEAIYTRSGHGVDVMRLRLWHTLARVQLALGDAAAALTTLDRLLPEARKGGEFEGAALAAPLLLQARALRQLQRADQGCAAAGEALALPEIDATTRASAGELYAACAQPAR